MDTTTAPQVGDFYRVTELYTGEVKTFRVKELNFLGKPNLVLLECPDNAGMMYFASHLKPEFKRAGYDA